MISEFRVLRRLVQLQREWNAIEGSEFVRGGRFMIGLCRKVVEDSLVEHKAMRDSYRRRINRWRSVELFHAAETALNLITRGDRARAIDTLRRVVDRDQTDRR